jgi:HEAT repeat protein
MVKTFRLGAIPNRTLSGPIAELDGRDTGKRRLAVMTLEATNLDLRPAVPALIRALSDDDKVVRKYAALALARAGESAQPAIPVLKECLNDPDAEVADAARCALKEIQKDEMPKAARPD